MGKTAGALACKAAAPHCIISLCVQHHTHPVRKRPTPYSSLMNVLD